MDVAPQPAPAGLDEPDAGLSTKAIMAAILAFVGLWLVPVVPSVLAALFARSALRDIARHPQVTGRGLAIGALAASVVGCIFWIVAVWTGLGGISLKFGY